MAEVKETKMTKTMYFEQLKEIVEASAAENADELVEFIDAQVEALAKKAEKAKERAAKVKAEGDELRETVLEAVTDELLTIDEITEIVKESNPDVTKAKVTARLTQLAKAEMVIKDTVKVESRKLVAYKRA